jgi:hypothetical protein
MQSVPGGKANILWGHSICHCPKGFHCTVPKLLVRKTGYLLFLITVFIGKWQSWYSLPSIIHFRNFHWHQCVLQLVWGHGVLLVCTVKQLYLGNRSEYDTCTQFLCRVTDTVTFPPGTHCIYIWDSTTFDYCSLLVSQPSLPFITPRRILGVLRRRVSWSLPSSGWPVVTFVCVAGMCLPSRCLAVGIHVTVRTHGWIIETYLLPGNLAKDWIYSPNITGLVRCLY